MKKEWNYNDWQGRSKGQVERNYKIMDWILTSAVVFIIGLTLYNIITSI